MTKKTALTLILTLGLALASTAEAVTDEEKCQKKKLIALGKLDLCLQKEAAKDVFGQSSDVAKCHVLFAKKIAQAEKKAACRWLEHGDGTVTDLNTGLQWELKTDDDSIHDVDYGYAWSQLGSTDPDGSLFTEFLAGVNGGGGGWSVDRQDAPSGCLADKCDWRIPTTLELEAIRDDTAPGCGAGSPCTTIPGETLATTYWTSTTSGAPAGASAWVVAFGDAAGVGGKDLGGRRARAVRGGR